MCKVTTNHDVTVKMLSLKELTVTIFGEKQGEGGEDETGETVRQQEEDREVREVSETWPQVATLLFLRPAPLGAGKEKTEFLKSSTLYFLLFPFLMCLHMKLCLLSLRF